MKKIFSLIIILSFVLISGNLITAQAEELEKIPSPDQIKLFEVIKKEGGSLFGFRLKPANNNERADQLETDDTNKQEKQLEKILSPEEIKFFKVIKKENNTLFGIRLKNEKNNDDTKDEVKNKEQNSTTKSESKLEVIPTSKDISFFENIKKIGNALWGIKKKPIKKPAIINTERAACVLPLIDAKDTAIKDLLAKQLTDRQQAITDRNSCQKAALSSTEKQRDNLEICNKKFKESNKTIQETYKKGHEATWKTYLTGLKECSKSITTENTTTNKEVSEEIIIEDGDNVEGLEIK